MKKRRYKEAFAAFCRLRNTELIAARDLVRSFHGWSIHQLTAFSTTRTVKSSPNVMLFRENLSFIGYGSYLLCLVSAAQ